MAGRTSSPGADEPKSGLHERAGSVNEKQPGSSGSSTSSPSRDRHDEMDNTIERIPTHEDVVERIPTRKSALDRVASTDFRRTASNAMDRVASRLTTRSWAEPPPPPDGGIKAWTQVAMGWAVVFTTWGYVNSFGAFQSYYASDLLSSEPPSNISWIGSLQTMLTLSIGAFSGRFLDAGYYLPTLFVGSMLQVLGMFLMSISTQYWQLMLTQGVLTGIGGGLFFTPSMALVTTYFEKRRGLAVGLVTTGNSAGGMIYPTIVRELLPKLGFGWTARVLAFINLGLFALVLTFMRPRLPPRKSGPLVDFSSFKEPVYASFVFAAFFAMWANYFTFYYLVSFGTDTLGLSYTDASILLVILNGVAMPFRIIFPMIADRIGPISVAAPLACAWFIISFCWLAVDSVAGYYVFTVFYGIASGSFQSLMPTSIASITERLDMQGTRLGMAFSVIALSSLTGPPIGGALLQTDGGAYMSAQIWAGVSMALGAALVVFTRVKKAGWDIKTWC